MENTYKPLQDYLGSQGQSFSQENLNKLAQSQGIVDYRGTNTQNKEIVNKINSSVTPIPLSNLNVPKANIPQAPVAPMQPAEIINPVDSYISTLKESQTKEQQQQSKLVENIQGLLGQTAGQSQALVEAQNTFSVNSKLDSLNKINAQIRMKEAELNMDDVALSQSIQNIEDKPIAMEFITGQQQSVARNAAIARAAKAAEINMLTARATAVQGDVALAQSMAQQAVENKYAPVKELLNLYKSQSEALQPILNAQEKQQSKEWDLKVQLAMQDTEDRKASEKARENMIMNASAQGAPQALLNQASQAKSSLQAAMVLGQYAGDYYKTELIKQQIATEKAQRAKIFNDIAVKAAQTQAVPTKEIQKAQSTYSKAQNLTTVAQNAINKLNSISGSTSVGRVVGQFLPGSTARDLEANIVTLKGALGFDELQEMRDQSPTGGALGQVTENELKFLQSAEYNLDVGQSTAQLKSQLEQVKNSFDYLGYVQEQYLSGNQSALTKEQYVQAREAAAKENAKRLLTSPAKINQEDFLNGL